MGSITDNVSALGFGAMRMPSSRTESINMIRYAIDNGVNYVDTAFTYHGGQSEVIVGKALLDGYREKVTLTTKSPLWMIKTREDFDKRLNKQLKRLKVNPDIYLFHGMKKDRLEKVKNLNLIEKMEEAKAEGKFKYIGFSFHDSFDSFKEIVDFYDWDCCQIQHNYIDVDFQAGINGLKYLEPNKITDTVQGIPFIKLNKLIEYKLSSGMYNKSGRLKDFAHIQELIKTNNLPKNFADKFRDDLKEKYIEIWDETN